MEKITLRLGDILQLESEINGFVNPETGKQVYEGFIKQNLSIMLKYELTELSEFLTKERKKVETLRDELIKKYGTEDGNGGILVKMFDDTKDDEGNIISSKYNENYLKFDEEYSVLLNTEKEFEYPDITKEDLKEAGKSNDNYKVLFKLIKKEPK
jgi:nuclear transport factor 2 (NTF2) superfamily protein